MSEQPLVSIIVPIYNAQNHIARCVESIRRQTYRNLEILLLNDGSQDVSLEVCKMYANVDPRIVLIDKANSGVAATRNMGLREAGGKYLQFVDGPLLVEEVGAHGLAAGLDVRQQRDDGFAQRREKFIALGNGQALLVAVQQHLVGVAIRCKVVGLGAALLCPRLFAAAQGLAGGVKPRPYALRNHFVL